MMSVLAVSAFAFSSCATSSGGGCDKKCCASKTCKAGCTKTCCAKKKSCAVGCTKACCAKP